MKIDIAKADLWWIREAIATSIDHMEGCPNPSAFSKTPAIARKTYKKLTKAMKGSHFNERYFPKEHK
jgi:hypothetical protein